MNGTMPDGLIVVTGAAGLIGSQIVTALAARGCRQIAVDFHAREERAGYSGS